ncbi:MAG: hypothetical protein HFE94_03630 [Acutalibacter sp.]|nr:hypothetical protein [Acutalibacter sp.]
MKIQNSGKRAIALILCAGLAISLAACQENPEGSIVAHKDMDKLISQAAAPDQEKAQAGDIAQEVSQNYESYQVNLDSESLGIKAQVDAQVEVPQVEKLSIYRVQQKKLDQGFIDRVRKALLGDQLLYDGRTLRVSTQADIEREIASLRRDMEEEEAFNREVMAENGSTQEEIEESVRQTRESFQGMINQLQEQYETAPAALDVTDFPFDGQLKSVEEQYSQDPEDEYYSWQYQLNPDGQVYFGITDSGDGNYGTLYVQNNADYGNKLEYTASTLGYASTGGVLPNWTPLGAEPLEDQRSSFEFEVQDVEAFWREKGLPGQVLTGGYAISQDMAFVPNPGWTANLTQAEAQAQAEAFLEKVGLADFAYAEGGLFTELTIPARLMETEQGGTPYGIYYILRYCRELDGVLLTQSSGEKFGESWDQNGGHNKQMWPGECVELRVNDSGIVGFAYNAPVEITETVVEGAALMPFDQIKETFEQMLPVKLASKDYQNAAKVDKVRLSYSRISEKDRFDSGLVVPVWSFEGSCSSYSEEHLAFTRNGVLLAINAIDGSIIDPNLGY